MATTPRFSSKALTGELRKLASEAVTITDDGTPMSREQILAKLIWDGALGTKTQERDTKGNLKEVVVKPVAWMQQFLFERLEGKAPLAIAEDTGGIKAAEKVRELSRDRMNKLAAKALTPVSSGPPKYKPKA